MVQSALNQGVGSDCCKLDTSLEVDPAAVPSRQLALVLRPNRLVPWMEPWPARFLAQRVLEVANLHVRLSTGTIKVRGLERLL